MSVWAADGLCSEHRGRPHDPARDVLFSTGHGKGVELLIAELSQAPFQSQRSKESAVSFSSVFQSPGAHGTAVRWTPHSHAVSSWFGPFLLWESVNIHAALTAELQSPSPPTARGYWHLRQRRKSFRDANVNGEEAASAARGDSIMTCHTSFPNRRRPPHAPQTLAWIRMTWCSRCWLLIAHPKPCLPKFIHTQTHTSVTPFPIVDLGSSVSSSGEHVTIFMVCITGSRMHWMLSTVNYTTLSSHSFIQEDSSCIRARDLCNLPARVVVTIEQGSCIFSIVFS